MVKELLVDVRKVADYFIYKSKFDDNHYSTISPLKLQKLIYYAQAWHATRHNGQKMFKEDIEAWVHGPVVPLIYNDYRHYGYNNITKNIQEIPECIENNPDVKTTLDVVWSLYNKFDAKTLEKMTHSEEPWKSARGSIPSYQSSNNIISIDSMMEYYQQYLGSS